MSNLIVKAEFSIRGIPNQGLTCYLASAIVSLCSLDDFLEFLIDFAKKNQSVSNNEKYNLFFRFVKLVESWKVSSISESTFEFQIQNFFDAFFSSYLSMSIYKRYHFHDASEFLIDFLCYLDESFIEVKRIHRDIQNSFINENNHEFYSIKNSFKISIKRRQICTLDNTHSKSETDTLMQIFLYIEDFETIEQCLDNYFSSTLIDQKLNCVHCNQFRKIQVAYKLESLSDNLIITFNRKKASLDNQTKIMKFIRISKRLDFSKHFFCTENVFEDYFDLKAIVFHGGNKIEDGHFTSLVRYKKTDSWIFLNDEHELLVSDMDTFIWQNRVNYQIYLLIYSRSENNEFKQIALHSPKKDKSLKEALNKKETDNINSSNLNVDVEMKRSKTSESLMMIDSENEDNFIREMTDFTPGIDKN
ncbi:unnamed protein product [Brachionus calyciflorus]|uniref:USP domain-containing protein n=1 Tax=Brachionus calyciflorus TaxID=104777 RepID=A0A813TPP2_9BILA|nr:unnamed protein product [Brachionus calyciflorus]